ncbi:unnamed protein product [Cuscuta epithymum]|uniref:RNase H type-1 domain-containing protein n=1 Tax=Cuscuta epithymum TaxID=186058 RepID=A0AAV0DLD2_9ASTE|nr:unnamed protein product [Cuscuta epithymum]
MAMEMGFDGFQVESNAVGVISMLKDDSGKYAGIQAFRRKAVGKRITFGHVFREANGPAHHLAGLYIQAAHSILFYSVRNMHSTVKSSYYAYLFGFPYFRI